MNFKLKNINKKQFVLTIIFTCFLLIQIIILTFIFDVINKNKNLNIVTSYVENSSLYSINSCTKLAKQQNEINIVTYNIGDDQKVCDKCKAEDRMKALMDLFKNNYADIIALQEVWLRKSGKPDFIEDMKALIPILGSEYNYIYRGHSDDDLTTKGSPNQGYGYANMIITKLPIRENSYKEYFVDKEIGDGEAQRYFFSVILETDSGPIRIYNIHTRSKESDWGVTEIAKFLASVTSTEPNMPFLVLGDFNQGIEYIQSQLGDPQYNLGINFSCSNKSLCFTGGIDLIFPNSKVELINRCQGTSTSNNIKISAPHVPVYATFKLLIPIIPTIQPSNLPTPNNTTVTPISSPTVIIQDKPDFDLEQDGKIDIHDFMKFVEYYKTSDCKIDYNGNNNCRDIDDFLLFSNYYKINQK